MDDLIDRIRTVTGQSYTQARTVAHTERTRVQGQARYESLKELNRSIGHRRKWRKEWIARADEKTRDTHAGLSGTVEYVERYFVTSEGNRLLYPGDPNAPAKEIIGCRCYIRGVRPN